METIEAASGSPSQPSPARPGLAQPGQSCQPVRLVSQRAKELEHSARPAGPAGHGSMAGREPADRGLVRVSRLIARGASVRSHGHRTAGGRISLGFRRLVARRSAPRRVALPTEGRWRCRWQPPPPPPPEGSTPTAPGSDQSHSALRADLLCTHDMALAPPAVDLCLREKLSERDCSRHWLLQNRCRGT